MERLTTYHGDVAVIKDKSRLSEAMAKLAYYEDLEELVVAKEREEYMSIDEDMAISESFTNGLLHGLKRGGVINE